MKVVYVQPERCVGCGQCRLACAVAHSKSGSLVSSIREIPRPRPRIGVLPAREAIAFPNKCRHCDPAPCVEACMPGALFRDRETHAVRVDANRCIGCQSCAMACPFGVLRFGPDPNAPVTRSVALKCDQCSSRQAQGRLPACVEACKTGALCFEDIHRVMEKRGREAAFRATLGLGRGQGDLPDSLWAVWRRMKTSV
ncbi:carbon-monoxide dehydrogenase iron sulfur subunit [Desulfacinum hydrothermale DSM 13146]|uniref:Carbon-monoxide dehydrogenase iron sulfur subunit n=1 Tax=Desulfacinum hydrothermale DSM 13146 TaxID=1121390 RepID=A0A1W1XDF4_9BACT|nr:4Fe-4S dicluster domain-containing protein [Desulfacinum hydrothermale]SMC21531.1 carbon-monoxide dehydrogenase iron sulfur subunit [Desulfacinum hydrothermale DSM 13146]